MSNFKIQIFTNNTFLLNYFEYEYNKLQENLDQCVLLKIEHFIEYKIYFLLFKLFLDNNKLIIYVFTRTNAVTN